MILYSIYILCCVCVVCAQINNVLPLSSMKIVKPKLEDYKYEFYIYSTQRSFTVCASSSKEKDTWLDNLHEAIDENVQRFRSYHQLKREVGASAIYLSIYVTEVI